MRRKLWFRPFATLLAVWFPLVIGEPGVLQPCPTHGALTSVASGAQADAQAEPMAHHHDASAEQASTASTASTTDQSTPGHDHHNCTCIGCCVGSAASAPAPDTPTTTFIVAVYDAAVSRTTVALSPRPGPEFSRPYNTGPPRV
jgi:hypothetical protein